ncbi:MAG: glycerophosphoryl diester phosphodiesterase membrane domain-containing protein, partial [Xanthomonadales bacterium]|nr:glycerophosphoryl diester phosphodiesterase membrane domain-containing protein [Xanthomonadales bacterium]
MMPELVKTTFFRLKSNWLQVLAVHLCYTGLGFILFAPLLGALGQVLLKLSGKPALADMDLLYFALSPAGAFAFILF